MLKNILILSNIFFTLLLNVIFGEGVKVSQNIPSHVDPGSSFTVELTISKTDVSGFAKIQQQLPEGFTASSIETQGASFTFNDQKIKMIWMSLPETDEFTVKYNVDVAENVSGTFQVAGRFSYLFDNERKVIDLPNNTIVVGAEEQPIAQTEETTPTNTNSEDVQASCERTITDLGGKFKVEIKIAKTGISGFAKIQEILPSETTEVVKEESDKSVFSYINNKAKYVWMSLPADQEIIISYIVSGAGLTEEKLKQTTGTFSFLNDAETQKIKITNAGENTAEPLAENTPTEQVPQEESPTPEATEEIAQVEPETAIEEPIAVETEPVVEATPEPKPTSKPKPVITSVPDVQNGIVYKVQIAAGHENVTVKSYFASTYNFSESSIGIENHEGWIKYTIDGYGNYRGARDRRNVVTEGYEFPGPFVTAYNDGTRITVQEALMITNQKWIQ